MKTPTQTTAPAARTRVAFVKLAVSLLLAASPLVVVGLAGSDTAPATLAGSSYPDDVDLG